MSKAQRVILVVWWLTAVLCSCREAPGVEAGNSIYYWRTEWRLDSVERAFLKQYNIRKVYCRYFDVVMAPGHASTTGQQHGDDTLTPMPQATLRFGEKVTEGLTLVPTVFITEACMHQRHEGLAEKLVRRIVQMNETHGVTGVSEIQIDCDYTARSRERYYQFLEEVRREAQRHGLRVSTTIRLHQLAMKTPPADYGVLMLYNTGDPERFAERNPILDMRDVQPYLRYLKDYALPLAAAYPVFLWQRRAGNVRIEHWVEADEIVRVKRAVEKVRPSLRQLILTYHLDAENINRYDRKTYEEIYRH